MSGKIDQSLDEILSNQHKSAGRRRSSRKTARPATTAPVGGVHKTTKPARGNAAKPAPARGAKATGESKIIVSNLPKDVSESQIKEYFQSAVGGVKKADIVYGPGGVSRGIANVVFFQSDGARKAYQKLNGLLIDNRPIKVEVVVTGEMVPQPPSLSQRVSQPKAQPKSAAADKSTGKGAKPAAGAKGAQAKRGRAPRPKNARPTKKSADELDAEMADYFDAAKASGEANGVAPAPTNGDAPMEDEIM